MNSLSRDQVLWTAYRGGDKQALGQLIECYYGTLKHYGLKFMVDQDVVNDCIHELFLQLWTNCSTVNDTTSVKHYLLKALRHHILQYLRHQKRFLTQEANWWDSHIDAGDSETLLIQDETLADLIKSVQTQLATLPVREREALYLRYYQNLSIPEIAEVMQINRQSVANFLQKALNRLRKQWLVHGLTILCIFIIKNIL